MDEHALSLYGDALCVSDMPDCECLRSVNSVDVRLHAQRLSEGCAPQVPDGQGAGVSRLARQVRGRAENVVEDQCADTAVYVSWWPLVRGTQNEVRVYRSVGVVVNDQGGAPPDCGLQ